MCCRDQNDRLYDNGKNPFYLIRLPVNDKCNSDIGRLSCDMAACQKDQSQHCKSCQLLCPRQRNRQQIAADNLQQYQNKHNKHQKYAYLTNDFIYYIHTFQKCIFLFIIHIIIPLLLLLLP